MSRIHLLDDHTINQIAAGEVVERPASVVKELIENAIDAGATAIEAEIMAGGTSLMRVTDNGCGMSRADAALAVRRHATSKIRGAGELSSVSTLGFRGEALPTIAAVSRFFLLTRRAEDELATEVRIAGGGDAELLEAGAGPGTTVRVEDLFFNTPARRKFMKTTHTEGARINDCVVKQALAAPGVAFRLISNGKLSVRTPGTGSLRDAVVSVYGAAAGEALLPVSFADEDLAIEGFLTKPSMLRSSRAWQTFIVNGRVVESKAVARAVDNAYHSLLPKAGYPLAVLRVALPQASVDVNVHPRKAEVKFEDEGRIFKAVYKAVTDAVRPPGQRLEEVAASAAPPSARREKVETIPLPMDEAARPGPVLAPRFAAPAPDAADFTRVQAALRAAGGARDAKPRVGYEAPRIVPIAADAPPAHTPPVEENRRFSMTPVAQVALCFILAKDDDTLYIVDQHAAHERVLYDKFAALADGVPSQRLLVHPLLDFSARESELLEAHQALFYRLGFELSPSGENQFRLASLPSDVPAGEAEATLRNILSRLMEMHAPSAAEIRHACLAMTACKAAIKRGDELNLRQMELLLEALADTARPYTCPHGRPTILRFTGGELARMFKRT